MKISLVKAPFPPMDEVLTYFREALKEEFYRYWLSDLPHALDPLLVFPALKQVFSLKRAGFSVINTSLIHPLHIARSLESLFHLFPDTDFVIGFGAGDKLLARKLGIKWGVIPFLERLKLLLNSLEEKERSSLKNLSKLIKVRYAVGTQNENVILALPPKIQGLIINSSSITEISYLTSLRKFKEKFVLAPVLSSKKDLPRFNSLVTLSLRSLSHNVIDELDNNVKKLVMKAKRNGGVKVLSVEEQLIIGREFGLVLDDEVFSKLESISRLGVDELLVVAPSIADLHLVRSFLAKAFD